MIPALLTALAVSLALTLVLETVFFLVIGKRNKMDLLLLLLVNIITNPVVVLIYRILVIFVELRSFLIIIPLEILAVLTEGFYYKKYGRSFKRPYVFSLCANAFSYLTGLVLLTYVF